MTYHIKMKITRIITLNGHDCLIYKKGEIYPVNNWTAYELLKRNQATIIKGTN